MIFKNHRGEVPGYVIGLIIAVLILLISAGVFVKIKSAQKQAGDQASNTCGFGGGECKAAGTTCATETIPFASCSNNGVCCKTAAQTG